MVIFFMHVFNSNLGQMELHVPDEISVDLFCGGGGSSMGYEMAFGRPIDYAINHNPKAIAMHAVNHPHTVHYNESVWDVCPMRVCNGRRVFMLLASPDCTHFSKAAGKRPVNKKIRGLAWSVVKWALLADVRQFQMENVEEFKTWGPLDADNHPDKTRSGETFDGFKLALTTGLKPSHPAWREAVSVLGIQYDIKLKLKLSRGLGYDIEHKELVASDLGAPTSRKRFFMYGRKDGEPIRWPEPTHGDPRSKNFQSGSLKPWVAAHQSIDFSLPYKSIFTRKRALVPKSNIRIARGVVKYVLENPEPFIIELGKDQSSTLDNHDLCMGFIAQHYGGNYTGAGLPLSRPLGTITATDHHALCAVHLVKYRGSEFGQDVNRPIPTVTASGLHIGEVRTYLKEYVGPVVDNELPLGVIEYKGGYYCIADISMRMLEPHELYAAQGFPKNYIFNRTADGEILTKKDQVRMCGNSVPPLMAKALLAVNNADQAIKYKAA